MKHPGRRDARLNRAAKEHSITPWRLVQSAAVSGTARKMARALVVALQSLSRDYSIVYVVALEQDIIK